ncbi:MAG: UDP-N-acetylmuramoyl-L-alanyl-D-glutamate--LD-lysine ligase [candidate division WS6 bacterium OLB20]|uniref:UDP-N-acetylmuramoyl-L-alanyl-D-glutamate--LD-lysine ligase n=1 Tax=candidate division WS6 bacterium OLB20 TaxID=1617426 RepID=A0A136M0I8_9BACT|nr:MAG: UDP-N-acetylmuramoyl-L-alanyl-D-glutamate--LD-lysine ligase [candidate division WS6 bacterium OLB20]
MSRSAELNLRTKTRYTKLPVIGDYNQENALAAIEVTSRYVTAEQIASALETLPVPKGRMEIVAKKPVTVIIDFAHTGHALEEALKAVNKIRGKQSRVITVFGCAGRRDRSRRSMGEVASRLADVLVLTAEDPRNEKLASINTEIATFAEANKGKIIQRFAKQADYRAADIAALARNVKNSAEGGCVPVVCFDEDSVNSRLDAIDAAIGIAEPGDIVFVTGKAHEQSLCFGETEYPWSDHEAVAAVLDKQKEK